MQGHIMRPWDLNKGIRITTQQTILDDIARNIGYVFTDGKGVIGYCCIIIGDEPAYHVIDGAWKTDRPYAVVHRMAFSRESRGS